VILHESGYRVVGVTLRLFCYAGARTSERACCNERALRRARAVCTRLGIPHHIVDVEDAFARLVINRFVLAYARGRTPNPCIACNEHVKFPALLRTADVLGAEHIATGHYARLARRRGGAPLLARAADRDKDQSYFLYRVAAGTLGRVLFPVGGMKKDEARETVSALDVEPGRGRESQDVCFIPDGDLAAFLGARIAPRRGRIVDPSGRVLGRHEGIHRYTVGQRKGLGVSAPAPRYVKEIDAARNEIVLAAEKELYERDIICTHVRLRSRTLDASYRAKIRYRHPPAAVETVRRCGASLAVRFSRAQRAATPGQSLVLYEGDIVAGGGIISRTGTGGSP
jgi:tRNA-specific 2-thiouridylase